MAKVKGLFVRSFEKSFRRAGQRFDRAGRFVPLDQLTAEQIAALKADTKNLIVDEREQELVASVIGGITADGRVVELKNFKVDELKKLATELGIADAAGMKKDDLVDAIIAIEAKADNEQE